MKKVPRVERDIVIRMVIYRGIVSGASCILLLSLLFVFSEPARADGGAPNLAYVAGTTPGVSVIDVAQQKVTGTLAVAGDPQMLLLSVDGRLLYVAEPGLKQVAIIETSSKAMVCRASFPGHPTLLALDPGTNMLYVAGNDASIVEALDPQTCMVRHTVDVGGFVSGIAVAVVGSGVAGGNGNELWVSTDHALMIYDAVGKALASIPMTDDPGYLCIPAGAVAYVVTRQGVVDAVDLHSRRILAPLLTGGNFAPMDYDATTGEVYVPDRLHHQLDVLAPVSPGTMALPHEPERIIPVDAVPQSIAITSDGQLGFVALEDGTVMMLDIPGRQTIHRFSVGGHPRFIITGLYPSVISLTPQQSTIYAIVDNVAHYAASVVVVLITIIAIVVHRRKMRRSQ